MINIAVDMLGIMRRTTNESVGLAKNEKNKILGRYKGANVLRR